MRRFLAVYIICIVGIAAYAWQTTPNRSTNMTGFIPAPSLDDYAWLASVTVVKALPALLVLLGCAYIAARIWTHLRYAHTDEAGRLPIPRQHLADVATEALAAYHTVELERARNQVPERFHYAPHMRLQNTAAAPPMLEEHAPAIEAPSFSSLLDRGLVGSGQPLILGYTNGTPLTGSWKDLYSSAVAGISGSGKTTTIRFLAAQAALHGARFAILDPHADTGDESLAATLRALQPAMLCEPAINERDMLAVVKLMQSQLDARLHGSADRTPLLLCVDEFTRLMRSQTMAAPLAGLLESIADEGRKVGIFCTLSGQSWTSDRAGGTPLRDSLASCYVHRLRRNQARLLLSTDEARLAEALEPGRALLLRTNGDLQPVSIPCTTGFDVERVGTLLVPNVKPVCTQIETTAAASTSASQSAKTPSPEAARIIDMFRAGNDVAAIVKTLWPEAEKGARYQQRSAEVQRVIRQAL